VRSHARILAVDAAIDTGSGRPADISYVSRPKRSMLLRNINGLLARWRRGETT
jgi:hypothetical protein